jgi:hypothetical protein
LLSGCPPFYGETSKEIIKSIELGEYNFELDEFNDWLIPLFPNGDYTFFLTSDFKNILFADGINFTISFAGEDIVQEVKSLAINILNKQII